MSISIFDIIGPRMIGPSSSHTAGAVRIGQVANRLVNGKVRAARVTLYGSFAKTGRGHGTDTAIVAGILGVNPDSYERLRPELPILDTLEPWEEKIFLDISHLKKRILLKPNFVLNDDRRNTKTFERADEKGKMLRKSAGVTVVDDRLSGDFQNVIDRAEARGHVHAFVVGLALEC